jgi:hypothetical protein
MHDLKTFTCANGAVTIRIPEPWTGRAHERDKGRWGCYEDDNDTGTLWISVDHYRGDAAKELPDFLNPNFFNDEKTIDGIVEEAAAKLPPLLESKLTPVAQGYHWRCVYDVEEDGEPLRFFFSRFFLTSGPNFAIISFNLVLTHAQMNAPDFIAFRDIMDREIRIARLDPFGDIEVSDAAKIFSPFRLINFADQVKLILPEAMGCWPDDEDEEAEHQWYCRLETETSHAGMFVTMEEIAHFEDPGEVEISLLDEVYAEVLEKHINEQNESRRLVQMPGGVLAYDVYDDRGDPADDEDDPGNHNHLWRYLQVDQGKTKILQILLIIPLTEKDDEPYPALAAYINRAVWRAEFPEAE